MGPIPRYRHLSQMTALGTLILASLSLFTMQPALAHAVAGARVFLPTLTMDDPGVSDEASLPTIQYRRSGADEMLAGIEDHVARAVSTAERALLAEPDGSCRTPIGGHARLLLDGRLHLMGLVARADGSFLLKRSLYGPVKDAARISAELGRSLRADRPRDIFT